MYIVLVAGSVLSAVTVLLFYLIISPHMAIYGLSAAHGSNSKSPTEAEG